MHLLFCSTQCIDRCPVRGDAESERLKLLEDICSDSKQFPKSYWLDNVSQGGLISIGGEASVHKGAYRGCGVVIRKLHCVTQSTSEQSDLMEVRTDVPLSYLMALQIEALVYSFSFVKSFLTGSSDIQTSSH
jgi:hypothetical protein